MINVNWSNNGQRYYLLEELNLNHPYFTNTSGVYVIWHGGSKPAALRVGQGHIASRLNEHRQNPSISSYKNLGIYVTWTNIPDQYLDGVELYLATQYNPKIGDRFPNTTPIAVNLP